jgi:hypothetical protein
MGKEIKTLDGVMNLDDSNDVLPLNNHREARNGVFKGNAPEMHFTAIRGNVKVNNGAMAFNDCKLAGNALFIPDCSLAGTALYIPKCELVGNAILQVNFSVTATCSLNDATIVISAITGGGGTYEIGTLAYSSEANALAGTTFTTANTLTFNNMPDGTLWFVVRDKNNTSNIIAKSVVIACDGTSTECRNSVSVVINAVPTQVFYQDCCGVSKNVSYATVGTFTITDCIKGGSLSSPNAGFASFTYSATTCICPPPDTTANWVDQNYNVCIGCVSYDVYKDTNSNSVTYLKYKVNDVIGTTTAPTESACNTTASYSENVGTYYQCIGGQVNEYIIYKNTNTCFVGNQWSRGTSGTITYANNPVNTAPDTDRILVSQEFNYCYNCVTYLVYRDKNACSPTWNEYFVNDTVSLGQTTPPAGDCSTTAVWTSQAYNTCSSCVNYLVYRDTNCSSPTYNNYRVNGVNVGNTAPSNGNCVTTPLLVAKGFNTCYNCANYAVFRDERPCSATFNNYILNQPPSPTFINVGNTEPSNGNCSTAENWVNEGARICVDCTSYQPQRNIAPCSGATYNTVRNSDGVYGAAPCNTTTPSYTTFQGNYHYCSAGTVYIVPVYSNTNVCYSGMATAQFRADFGGGNYLYYGIGNSPVNSYPSTTANFINRPIDQYWECVGNVRYYQQIDINQCSITVGQTQRGAMDGIVAGYCGYNPVTCVSYDVYNSDTNYDVYISYEQCGGTTVYDSVGPGMTMNVCAVENTVNGGGGYVTNVGTCSS